MLDNLACHLRYAVFVMIVVVVIICLSQWTGKTPGPGGRTEVKKVVERAMADSNAARSNVNRMEALLDVTAALATLQTATSLAGQPAVDNIVGGSVRAVEAQLMDHQHQIMMDLDRKTSLLPLPKI